MLKNNKIFSDFLNKIKAEDRYRIFTEINRNKNRWPTVTHHNKDLEMWCGTDYLSMSTHLVPQQAMENAMNLYGVGSGGTRNIAGNYDLINQLEDSIANLHKKEKGLVFSSGYLSNFASISALGKITNKKMVIFSDELNHASIIDGIKNSGCQKIVFRHNDECHLEELLSQFPIETPKIIIFESIYSMNGSVGKIKEFCDLADKFNAFTFIDEVHAVAVYGQNGGGISQLLNLESRIDIIQGSFSKGYGVIGGYITGKTEIIDAIRSAGSGFIFTSTMPIAVCAACLASVEYLKNHQTEREIYFNNLKYMLNALKENNISLISNNSHIMSVAINDATKAKEISKHLLNNFNIYVQHINYPTVAKGQERLRISITPHHTPKMIDRFVKCLKNTLDYFEIINIHNYNNICSDLLIHN